MSNAPDSFFRAMSALTSPVWMSIDCSGDHRYVTFADLRGNAVQAVYEKNTVLDWRQKTHFLSTYDPR